MIHSPHHSRKRRRRHAWLAFLVIITPAIILFVFGAFAGVDWHQLSGELSISFYRLIVGYILSLVIGVSLAVLIGESTRAGVALSIFDVLQNLPSFALIPLFVMIFGYTTNMMIVFVATSATWPILFYTLNAIHTAKSELADAATVFGARGFKRIVHYLIPVSFPSIVTGSIVAVSIGWEAVLGIEIISGKDGIGTFINHAGDLGKTDTLFAGILAILCLVFIVNRIVWVPLIERTQRYVD